MRKKIQRTLNICSLPISLEELSKNIVYARRQIRIDEPDINDKDIDIFLNSDSSQLVAEWKSQETVTEERERLQKETFMEMFNQAKTARMTEFTVTDSLENLSVFAGVLSKLRYSEKDCFIYGTPIFKDDLSDVQTGIRVNIRYL